MASDYSHVWSSARLTRLLWVYTQSVIRDTVTDEAALDPRHHDGRCGSAAIALCLGDLPDAAGLVETYYSKIRIKTRAEVVS